MRLFGIRLICICVTRSIYHETFNAAIQMRDIEEKSNGEDAWSFYFFRFYLLEVSVRAMNGIVTVVV